MKMRHLTRNQALGLAGVIAVIVAAMVYVVLTAQTSTEDEAAEQVLTVVTATSDIAPFQTVTAEMVATEEKPAASVPPRHFSSAGDVVGQIAQRPIATGETIAAGDVAARTAAGGLTYLIPDGMRAVTVAIDPVSGVAGFALPGDRVDVLTTSRREEEAFTKTILQDVLVLAVGQATTRPQSGAARPAVSDRQVAATAQPVSQTAGSEEAPTAEAEVTNATLAMMPDEAQTLVLAAATGSIHLVLRPPEDTSTVSLSACADWEMMGLPEPVKEAKAEPPPPEQPQPVMPAAYQPAPNAPAVTPAPQRAPTPPASGDEPEDAAVIEIVRGTDREIVEID